MNLKIDIQGLSVGSRQPDQFFHSFINNKAHTHANKE